MPPAHIGAPNATLAKENKAAAPFVCAGRPPTEADVEVEVVVLLVLMLSLLELVLVLLGPGGDVGISLEKTQTTWAATVGMIVLLSSLTMSIPNSCVNMSDETRQRK